MAFGDFVRAADNEADPASATFGGTPTAGNVLVAIAMERSGQTSAGNFNITGTDWTQRIGRIIQSGDSTYRRTLIVWTKIAGSSEPTNVQVDDGTANTKQLLIAEFDAGGLTLEYKDGASNDNGATSNAEDVATGTTTGSTSGTNQLLIGVHGIKTSGTWTSGYVTTWSSVTLTERETAPASLGGNGRGLAVSSATSSATGTKASTSSISTGIGTKDNVGLAAGILVFGESGGGGGGLSLPIVHHYNARHKA